MVLFQTPRKRMWQFQVPVDSGDENDDDEDDNFDEEYVGDFTKALHKPNG